jgi:hypothetical protein
MHENGVLVLRNDQGMLGCLLHAPRGLFYSPKAARSRWRQSGKEILAFCRVVSAFRPGGSLDRRVNCRRVPQPRWVGARRSTNGGRKQAKGKPAAFVLPCAQVGSACSRGLQAFAWESLTRRPVLPRGQPSCTRALDLPFIGVRRGSRCTMGV